MDISVPAQHVPEQMQTQPIRHAANLWNQDLGYRAYWHSTSTMTNRGGRTSITLRGAISAQGLTGSLISGPQLLVSKMQKSAKTVRKIPPEPAFT
eukprot:5746263-Pyramimonas_sp.AAC.1